MNIGYIDQNLTKFPLTDGVIDLEAMGYEKLLGKGAVNNKLQIKVALASNNAVEKVKKAGGKVVLSSQDEASE